jgi:hypothetical protein
MASDPALKRCIGCEADGIASLRKTPHPGPRCATHHRQRRKSRRSYSHERHISETYGITTVEYQSIYDYQGGSCAICQRATGAYKRLSVDHCHSTGLVRGLLCQKCNRDVLGHLRDDPAAFARAAAYLKRPPAVEAIGRRITPDMEQ